MSGELTTQEKTRRAVAAALASADDGNQSQLARILGLSRQATHTYAKAGQTPRLDVAVQIADALGLTLDELAGREPLPARAGGLHGLLRDLVKIADAQQALAASLTALARDAVQIAGTTARGAGVADPAAAAGAAKAAGPEIAEGVGAVRRAEALIPDPDEKAGRRQAESPPEQSESA